MFRHPTSAADASLAVRSAASTGKPGLANAAAIGSRAGVAHGRRSDPASQCRNALVKAVGRAMNIDVKIPHYPVTPLVVAGHICEKACKPFGITPPIFPRRVDWYRQNRAFKIDKAKRELNYAPRVNLDEGLSKTYQWYKAEGYL
jgi:nucleoside-diphosphate-sugar epimerase